MNFDRSFGNYEKVWQINWLCLSPKFSAIFMNKIQNPLKVLKAKTKEAWSGCIEIAEPQDASVGWNVYLLEGKIQYINSTVGQQERLNYLWQRFKLGSQCPQLNKETSEYVQLCQSLSDKQLSDLDIKKLLYMFTREGLVNVLSIDKSQIKFKPAKRIKKPVVSFGLDKLGAKLKEQIKRQIDIRSYLDSNFSRLYVEQKDALKFYKIWKPKYISSEFTAVAEKQKLSSFVSLFVAKNSLYYIATKAEVDTHFLAQHLKESIAEKILELYPFQELTSETALDPKLDPETQKAKARQKKGLNDSHPSNLPTLIVCVDDSKTVQKQVKMTLEAGGYQVLGISDPTIALKTLAHHQPAVILLDINMPKLNGYDLCSLLRKSQKFKEIPIVMLTGRDGMIDRVRAKLVGATDYLTKPCDPNKLITLTKALEKSTISV